MFVCLYDYFVSLVVSCPFACCLGNLAFVIFCIFSTLSLCRCFTFLYGCACHCDHFVIFEDVLYLLVDLFSLCFSFGYFAFFVPVLYFFLVILQHLVVFHLFVVILYVCGQFGSSLFSCIPLWMFVFLFVAVFSIFLGYFQGRTKIYLTPWPV